MFYSNPFRPNLNQQGVILQDIQRANDSFYSLSQTYVNGDVMSGKILLASTADNAYNANHAITADSATSAINSTNAYKLLITNSDTWTLADLDCYHIYSNTPSYVTSKQWGTNAFGDKGIFEFNLMLGGSNGFIFFWAPNNTNYSNTNFKQQFTQIYQNNTPTSSSNISQWNGFGIMTPFLTGSTKAFINMRVCCNTDHKYVQYQANAYSLSGNTYAQEIGHIFWSDNTSWDTVGGMYLMDASYNPIPSGYISGVIRRVL
jgi:hypothetical protein